MTIKPIPDGYHTVTPYLVVRGVNELIEFLKLAFDAQELHRTSQPNGMIMHAEIKIGDSPIMLGEAKGDFKPMPAMLYLYLQDVDSFYKRALEAGARSIMEPSNQFYGDRNAGVADIFGNQWWIASRIEHLSEQELQERAKAHCK